MFKKSMSIGVFAFTSCVTAQAQIVDAAKDWLSGAYAIPPVMADYSTAELNKSSLSHEEIRNAALNYTDEQIKAVKAKFDNSKAFIERDYHVYKAGVEASTVGLQQIIQSANQGNPIAEVTVSSLSTVVNSFVDSSKTASMAFVYQQLKTDLAKLPHPDLTQNQNEKDTWWAEHGAPLLTSKNLDTLYDGVTDPNEREAIRLQTDQDLRDIVYKNGSALEKNMTITEQNSAEIKKLIQGRAQITAKVNSIADNEIKLRSSVEKMADKIDSNSAATLHTASDLQNLSHIVYAQQPATVQLKAISTGALTFSNKEDEDVAIKTLETRKFIEDDFGNVVKQTAGLNQIAKNIGLAPEVTATVDQGLKIANAVMGVASNFASGNYIGAVMSLTSLFGSGGPDPEELRFKAIMSKLGVMDKKLDAIIENQKEMAKSLGRLEDSMFKVLEKLEIIDQHTDEIKEQTKQIQENTVGYNQCVELDQRKQNNDLFGKVVSYESNKKLISSMVNPGPTITACLQSFNIIFAEKDDVMGGYNGLLLSSEQNAFTSRVNLYSATIKLLNDFLKDDRKDSSVVSQNLFRIMNSVFSFNDIYYRASLLENFDSKSNDTIVVRAIDRALSPHALNKYGTTFLDNVHYRLVLTKDASKVIAPKDLLAYTKTSEFESQKKLALFTLNELHRFVDTAIAQQGLIAGDYLLTYLVNYFDETNLYLNPKTDHQISTKFASLSRDYIIKLFEQNSVLYQNFVRYMVYTRFKTFSSNPVSFYSKSLQNATREDGWQDTKYANLFFEKSIDNLKAAIALPDGFSLSKEVVHGQEQKSNDSSKIDNSVNFIVVTLDGCKDCKASLPNFYEIYPEGTSDKTAELLYTNDIKILLSLKRRIEQTVFEIQGFDNLNQDERKTAVALRLSSH